MGFLLGLLSTADFMNLHDNSNSDGETQATASTGQKRPGALQIGPRKKPCVCVFSQKSTFNTVLDTSCRTDPLMHHGRHFRRTVHALCTVGALLNNGIIRMGELAEQAENTLTQEYVTV
jgi:hypothetical protein